MIELSTLEINKLGFVLSVSEPKSSSLTGLLPHEGDNVLEYWDENTNNSMKGYVDAIFSAKGGIAFSMDINNNNIQFTAHHFAPNRAFLYCKPAKAKTPTELRKEQQVKLVDFAFRNAVIAVLFISEEGNIFDFNDETCRLLGYNQNEFRKLTITDLNPEMIGNYWKDAWIRHQTLITDIIYTKFKKKDGTFIDVEIRTKHFEHEGLEVLGTFINDITEKKRLEETSGKEKLLLRTLIDTLPFSVFVKDAHAQKLVANIMDVEYMGLTSESEAIGKTDLELYNDSERNIGYKEDLKVLTTGCSIVNNTGILVSNDGKKRHTSVTKVPLRDDEGNVYGLVGICKDITEEKKLAEESYKEKTLLRILIDNLPFSVFVKDYKARKLIANKWDVEFMGLVSEAEALGKTDLEIFGGVEMNHGYDEDMEVIGKGMRVIDSDNLVIDKNGNKSDWVVTKLPLKDEHGNIYGLVGICKDVTARKKEEEQLKLSNFAFKNTATPNHFFDKQGRVYDFNNAACSLLGYTEEEYKALTVFDLSVKIKPETWHDQWATIKGNSSQPHVSVLRRKDNSLVYVQMQTEIFVYEDKELGFSTFTDMTEKMKQDEQLKLVDFAFRESSIPIFFIEEDGRLLNVNNAAVALYGYRADEMRGMKVRMVSATQSDEVYQQQFDNVWKIIKEKGRHLIITNHKKKNGEILDIEINFNYIEFGGKKLNCAFLKDITDKKKVEDRLMLVDFIFQKTDVPIIIAKKNASFYEFNEAALELYGYTSDEMAGLSVFDLSVAYSKEEQSKVWPELWERIRQLETSVFYGKHKKKDGSLIDVEVRVNYIKYGGMELNCTFITDITKKRQAETEKEQLLSELLQSNLELKQFSYIATHNLRAPLTNLVSICNIIKSETITDRVTLKLIDGFKTSTHQLNDTLNDLISILIIKENIHLPTGRINFQDVLDRVKVSLLVNLIKEKVMLHADFDEAPFVSFSYIYLESILLNLITNSIHYRHPDRPPIINIRTSVAKDDKTILTFSDNGIGMNMERVKDKIFGLYQRFHGNADSKGIGLYLIHSQITALKGKIEVTSEVNVGTTFTVTFK